MENLNIEKFNPTKAEITILVEKYKGLEIKGVDDKVGFNAVDVARKELKKVRVNIQNTGKSLRADAVAFQKAVIEKEKELVGMVEPTEVALQEMQNNIELEKEKIKRRKSLPERQFKMKALEIEVDDEFLLLMDDSKFDAYYNQENANYLAKKEAKILAEQEKINEEKRKIEAENARIELEAKHQAEIERVKKEAEEKAKQDAIRLAEAEKAKKEKEEADRIENEKAVQAQLAKDKKYQAFLKKNGFKQGEDFIVQHDKNRVIIYKKIDEIIL